MNGRVAGRSSVDGHDLNRPAPAYVAVTWEG